jgi:hypothetical protein
MPTTREQVTAALAALKVLVAVGDAIREAGEISSGSLYAVVMGRLDMHRYETIIATLKNADLINESPAHLLRGSGPPAARASKG